MASKAAEWMRQWREADAYMKGAGQPHFGTNISDEQFVVDHDGDLAFMRGAARVMYLSPDEALKLAGWILDTFGEKEGGHE